MKQARLLTAIAVVLFASSAFAVSSATVTLQSVDLLSGGSSGALYDASSMRHESITGLVCLPSVATEQTHYLYSGNTTATLLLKWTTASTTTLVMPLRFYAPAAGISFVTTDTGAELFATRDRE